jgi:hypothetical protein
VLEDISKGKSEDHFIGEIMANGTNIPRETDPLNLKELNSETPPPDTFTQIDGKKDQHLKQVGREDQIVTDDHIPRSDRPFFEQSQRSSGRNRGLVNIPLIS